MKKHKKLEKDQYGLLYSTELLLSIILLIFIIGIIANLSDTLNERMLSEEEFSSMEKIAVESCDYLLNNPGNPENWQEDKNLDNGIVSTSIIPGLAIKKRDIENGQFYDESTSDDKVISSSISYNKLMKIKNNYNDLVDENLFNNSFKSSMAIYPLNSEIGPLMMGDDLSDNNIQSHDNVNDNNIITVSRIAQCDFYSNFVVYNFNDLELSGEDYKRTELCNHDTSSKLESHENDGSSVWLCKNFRVYKKSLEDYNYYLISDDTIKNSNSYWILESMNRPNDNEQRLDNDLIDLNPFFLKDLENSSNEIYSIHFNIDKNHMDDFKTVLVAIPKNMTNDLMASGEMKYEYFKSQEVKFVLKIAKN